MDTPGELDGVDHSPHPREIENARRMRVARGYADQAAIPDASYEKQIAYALRGLLEIAIVRADVRSYEPPF